MKKVSQTKNGARCYNPVTAWRAGHQAEQETKGEILRANISLLIIAGTFGKHL